MLTRKADAEWKGNLAEGSGRLKVGSGAFDGAYSFKSRFEEGQAATNPEELIGAAHAGCFTMALTAQLSRAGIAPRRIHTGARVTLEKVGDQFSITKIELETEADIPGIDNEAFQKYALEAKQGVPFRRHWRERRFICMQYWCSETEGAAMTPGDVLLRAEDRLAHELLAGKPHERGKIVLAVDERCENQEEPHGPST